MGTFKKPALDLANKSLIAIFTAHNEAERLPFFLSYYRSLGVRHFLAIDNNSTDHTKDILTKQSDVTYFFTSDSYVSSRAGRLWTSELADHYCKGKWCLTLDLDEQLVFPGCEHVSLEDLCDYLDEHGFEGIFTVFLDMYGGGTLSEAIYTPGEPFLRTCNYFDADTYTLTRPMHFPHLQVFGGPRQRLFWERGESGNGPSMRKLPLVKWRKGFRYINSTHSSSALRLADVTGALLHFKFFSSFKTLAEREVARGDRVQKHHYEAYLRLTREQDISFRSEHSVQYQSSITLVDHGVMVCTKQFIEWSEQRLRDYGDEIAARRYLKQLRASTRKQADEARLTIKQLPLLWPLLGNIRDAGVFGCLDNEIVGWYIEKYSREPSHHIQAWIGDEVVASCETGEFLLEHALVSPDRRSSSFKIVVPVGFLEGRSFVKVVLRAKGDQAPFATVILSDNSVTRDSKFGGACVENDKALLCGWARVTNNPLKRVRLSVFVNGEFLRQIVADLKEADFETSDLFNGHLFQSEVRSADKEGNLQISCTFHGTNFHLERSPLVVTGQRVRAQTERGSPSTTAKNKLRPRRGFFDAEIDRLLDG